MRSVPGALATGSQRSRLNRDRDDQTRSLSLPVLTSRLTQPLARSRTSNNASRVRQLISDGRLIGHASRLSVLAGARLKPPPQSDLKKNLRSYDKNRSR